MAAFNDLGIDRAANETAAEFVRAKIRAKVRDPATAAALLPTSHAIGTKRLCVDSAYYEAFNRPNVTLVDLRRTPIIAITPDGIRTSDAEHRVDSIVFATGFDAMTGSITRIAITGPEGASLAEKWAAGPRTYLGVMTAGFPNLFMITGPGSPSVLSNMMVSIEQHVEWIAECLGFMQVRGLDRHRTDAGGRGRLGRACERGRRAHAPPDREFLVHGRQHPRQACCVHALYRRRRPLPTDLRRDRRGGLSRLRAGEGAGRSGVAHAALALAREASTRAW